MEPTAAVVVVVAERGDFEVAAVADVNETSCKFSFPLLKKSMTAQQKIK